MSTGPCLGHAVRLATHYPFSASLVSYAANCMHAHARAASALQFLRSHAPQPAILSPLGHAVRLATHYPFSASLVSYAAICMHAVHAPPVHCSSCARMFYDCFCWGLRGCLLGPHCAPGHTLSLFREPSLLRSFLHARACTRRRQGCSQALRRPLH